MNSDSANDNLPQIEPSDRRALIAGLGGLAAGAFLASARTAHAGPLNPPAGALSPTGLTLDDLAARTSRPAGIAEPRRPLPDASGSFNITESGSYYLTRSGSVGSITISASDVTLDLCGFTASSTSFTSGAISLSNACRRVRIGNGRIEANGSPGQAGVLSIYSVDLTLEDLQIVSSGSTGTGVTLATGLLTCRRVSVAGFASGIEAAAGVVEDCRTDTAQGIVMSSSPAVVRRCFVRGVSSSVGIAVSDFSAVIDCQVNQTGTFPSILIGNGSLVDQCVVAGGRPGIVTDTNCTVVRTVVRRAQGVGIDAGWSTRVADCHVSATIAVAGGDPGIGVRGAQRLRLERSTIANNLSDGVRVSSFDAAIADCSIILNSGVGISCVGPAMIDRCHLANNNNGGIQFDALTRVSQCHLDFNGATGILASSTGVGGTFITDCDITRHTTGVDIRTPSGSGVFRSRFAGNTSANITAAAGNFQLTVAGAAAANAATNPNVNIAL